MKTMLTLGLVALWPAFAHAGAGDKAADLVIANVTLIDATGAPPQPGVTVLLGEGRIKAIAPVKDLEPPAGAQVIDARGKYLIPGLWDMHVHFSDPSFLPLFLANGVTGVRVMWGNPNVGMASLLSPRPHDKMRKEIDEGSLLGPRLVVASNIIDGPKPAWPNSISVKNAEEARAAVRAAKKAGADFVKVYSLLPREAYFAIADECKALGLPFAGHVPYSVSVREASAAGQKSFEHVYGVDIACSTSEDRFMTERADALTKNLGIRGMLPVVDAQQAAIDESYDEAKGRELFGTLRENNTWQCPTLIVHYSMASLDDPQFVDDPRMRYMPYWMKSFWSPKSDPRLKNMKAEDYVILRKDYERAVKLVGKLHAAGVGILAGTDEMNPYCFPGFSLHDELGLLVKAGLTPLEAIQAATRNPARYLGRERMQGTIEVGKDADLVLLDADPLADIANTKKVQAVILRDKLLDRPALDKMLAAAEAANGGASRAKKDAAKRVQPSGATRAGGGILGAR